MKPRVYNRDLKQKRFSCTLVAFCFAIQSTAQALPPNVPAAVSKVKSQKTSKRDLEKLLSFSQFTGLLGAVGELNQAMRSAAENPMDGWRRERVQAAMAALPGAIRSLAGVFQSNQLGDSKFPMVQQILGGYVDVNAADNYNKFLRAPAASLIPRLGSEFPKEYLGSTNGNGSSQSLVMNEGAPEKNMPEKNMDVSKPVRLAPAKRPETIQLRPQFFNTLPLSVILASLSVPVAHAQGGEEKESGGKSAEMLFGLAAIIGAAAPMVAAGIQANADKAIARTNQQTAIATTQISANTSKYLADNQKAMSEAQMVVTQQISAMNNGETTQRLNLQLAELRAARQENNQLQRDKRDIEYQLNRERITLAQRQADDNVKLAKAALSAQITQAGLSQGLATATSAANRLSVNRNVGTVPSTLAPAGGGLIARTPSKLGTSVKTITNTQKAAMSSRLLSTLREDSLKTFYPTKVAKSRGIRAARNRKNRRGIQVISGSGSAASPVASRQLIQSMQSNLDVIGSSPDRRAGSDLSVFKAQVSSQGGEGFAAYRKRAVASAVSQANDGMPHAEAMQLRGYNQPTFIMEGSTHSLSNNGKGFFNLPRR